MSILLFCLIGTRHWLFFIKKLFCRNLFYTRLNCTTDSRVITSWNCRNYSEDRVFSRSLKIFHSFKKHNPASLNPLNPLEVRQHWITFHAALNPSVHKISLRIYFWWCLMLLSIPHNFLTLTWSVQPKEVLGATSLKVRLKRKNH